MIRRALLSLVPGLVLALGCPGPTQPSSPPPARRAVPPPDVRRPTPQRPRLPRVARRPSPPKPRFSALFRLGEKGRTFSDLVTANGRLVTLGANRELTGWEVTTRRILWRLKAPGAVTDLRLSAVGRSLLLTTRSGTNWVYTVAPGLPSNYRRWKRITGPNPGESQGLSRDGLMLIRGDVRGQVRGYELSSYKMKWLVRATQVVLSRDGLVAACVRGAQVTLVSSATGRVLDKPWTVSGRLLGLAVHSRSRRAQWIRQGTTCSLRLDNRPPIVRPCIAGVRLTWSPQGQLVAAYGLGRAVLFDAAGGRVLATFQGPPSRSLHIALVSETIFAVNQGDSSGGLSVYRLNRR